MTTTTDKELLKINDSLDSLHHRIDRFYAWASQLQVEFRDIKQRIGFIEDTIFNKPNFALNQPALFSICSEVHSDEDDKHCHCGDTEEELLSRLNALRS